MGITLQRLYLCILGRQQTCAHRCPGRVTALTVPLLQPRNRSTQRWSNPAVFPGVWVVCGLTQSTAPTASTPWTRLLPICKTVGQSRFLSSSEGRGGDAA